MMAVAASKEKNDSSSPSLAGSFLCSMQGELFRSMVKPDPMNSD